MNKLIIFWLLLSGWLTPATGQPILLRNPSFEDVPGYSRMPRGWFSCGVLGESPPDVHPAGHFGVNHAPQHGFTYVGMVVRDNNTREGVGQWLSTPLKAGQCYSFSIYAARSPRYESLSRVSWQMVNYDQPVRLLIWGGYLNCDREELLAASPLIDHTEWQAHTFYLQPQADYDRLLIEAQYAEPDQPYCGNVLLDRASPLLPVDCDSHAPLFSLEQLPPPIFDSEDRLAHFADSIAALIRFSYLDWQLEQHIFLTSDSALQQGNRYLYHFIQIMQNFPKRKFSVLILEKDKTRFHAKLESLSRELLLYGAPYWQFVIKQAKPLTASNPNPPELRILIR